MTTETTALVRYDEMCRVIAEVYKVDEVKEIRDRAIALAAYMRQIENWEAEDQCSKIRLRAERRVAEIYDKETKATGAPGPGRGKAGQSAGPAFNDASTLADYNITKQQMSEWRKLAAIPEQEFEAEIVRQFKPTVASIIAATTAEEPKPLARVSDEALWLWGRLCDFENEEDGLLHRDPQDILKTMTGEMLKDTIELAPLVAAWLLRITGDRH